MTFNNAPRRRMLQSESLKRDELIVLFCQKDCKEFQSQKKNRKNSREKVIFIVLYPREEKLCVRASLELALEIFTLIAHTYTLLR